MKSTPAQHAVDGVVVIIGDVDVPVPRLEDVHGAAQGGLAAQKAGEEGLVGDLAVCVKVNPAHVVAGLLRAVP